MILTCNSAVASLMLSRFLRYFSTCKSCKNKSISKLSWFAVILELPAHTNCILSTTFIQQCFLSQCVKKKCPNNKKEIYIYQIVHSTKGHMAVYGLGCHPQNIIWTEAKLRSIYYFVGDRPVHKLPFGPKCHELFVIFMQICQMTCFCYCISKTKNKFGQNPEENIILIWPGQYTKY